MGIGNSRERSGLGSSSPGSGIGGQYYNGGYFRQRRLSPTKQRIPPIITQPLSYQPLYGPYYGARPVAAYAPLQPISLPFLPLSYNNYPAPSYIPPQYMMMPPQRVPTNMPTPYMSPPPPMLMPYGQQPQAQPVYNNIGFPAWMPGGNAYYPSSYPSAPGRLLTDWTGGGMISPGFLGPPI